MVDFRSKANDALATSETGGEQFHVVSQDEQRGDDSVLLWDCFAGAGSGTGCGRYGWIGERGKGGDVPD
jgi:hypothetical protein